MVDKVDSAVSEGCILCGEPTKIYVQGSEVDGCEDLGDTLVPLCTGCADENKEHNDA